MSHGHFIEYGSCGHVIAQCRCPDPNKDVRRSNRLCDACERAMKVGKAQGTHLSEQEADALRKRLDIPSKPAEQGSEASPRYFKVHEANGHATTTCMIVCCEGWRQSIVCTGMYEWAADWMLTVLGNRPFAPGRVPA